MPPKAGWIMIKRLLCGGLAVLGIASTVAGAVDAPASLMARYAQEAGMPVSALSATRGAALYRTEHPGRNGQAVSCASCHTANPKQAGRSRVGKRIEPMATATNPDRFTDAAKVEKWFRRNCQDVLQRECSAQEKGDFIAWLSQIE
jgi:mono/diheme cytochrome c family protein